MNYYTFVYINFKKNAYFSRIRMLIIIQFYILDTFPPFFDLQIQ